MSETMELPKGVAEYALSMEYSLGNGQCPLCFGLDPDKEWRKDRELGHREGCAYLEVQK